MARTPLVDANLPDKFWDDAVLTEVYIITRLPTPLLNSLSPFHKLFLCPYTMVFYVFLEANVFQTLHPTQKINFNLG